MKSGIYQILNKVNGRRYIGSALTLANRLALHYYLLRSNKHYNCYLQRAWNKYGEESFIFATLLYCCKEDLIFYEQRAINAYSKSVRGVYNLSPTAGNNLGVKFSDAIRHKISASQKGKIIPLEQRKRISQTLKKNHHVPWNKGTKGLMVAWNKGLKGVTVAWNKGSKLSDEHRQKLSISHKGYVMPANQRCKISKSLKGVCPNRGYSHSEEVRQRISSTLSGHKHTPDSLIRRSAAKTRWWNTKKYGKPYIRTKFGEEVVRRIV